MFYERFLDLCNEKGIKPSRVAVETGFNKGSISVWKKKYENGEDTQPTSEILSKIADYFCVTIDYLLGKTDNSLTDEDKEIKEYLEFLKYRPEGKMLFSVAKGCTKEEIEQAVKIIDALRKTGDD